MIRYYWYKYQINKLKKRLYNLTVVYRHADHLDDLGANLYTMPERFDYLDETMEIFRKDATPVLSDIIKANIEHYKTILYTKEGINVR